MEPGPLSWVEYPAAEVALVGNPHVYQGRPVCQACHENEQGALLADVNTLCTGCHTWNHVSHPVGVPLKEPVPDGVSVGEGNVLLCTSCHVVHEVGWQEGGLRKDYSTLCQTCHAGY